MYIIVTYARTGMKGVQARGIRVAQKLGKDNVLFWNDGDSSWLEKEKLQFKELEFKRFALSTDVIFPNDTQAVVFADLPTNRPYQVAILLAARRKNIPIVVLENIYHKGQFEEFVYKNTTDFCDLMIFNGFNYLWPRNKPRKVDFVPPLLPEKLEYSKAKAKVENHLGIELPENVLVSVGYNESVIKILEKIAEFFKSRKDIIILAIGTSQTLERRGNLVYLPRQDEEGIREIFSVAKIVFAKPGFLQVQEALAYSLPLLTLGKEAGFRQSWIDRETLDLIHHYDDFSNDLAEKVDQILSGKDKSLQEGLKKIHGGELDGATKIAKLIKEVKVSDKSSEKKILLSLDKKEEREVAKRIIKENSFILPIFISVGFFTGEKDSRLSEFKVQNKDEILQQGISVVIDYGDDSVHSLSKIFPMYDDLMESVKGLIDSADEVIVVGEETESFFSDFLKGAKVKLIKDQSFVYNKKGK